MDEHETRQITPIFVSAKLDDLGLSLGAYRVIGHLSRRGATKPEGAWPSAASIGEVCGIKDADTVWKYLNEGIAFGVLRCVKRPGSSNVWFINPDSHWKQPTRKNRAPRKSRLTGKIADLPETTGHPVAEIIGHPLPGKTGHEGYPEKETKEGNQAEGEPSSLALAPATTRRRDSFVEVGFPWHSHEQLPEWFWRMLRWEHEATFERLEAGFYRIRERKIRHKDRLPLLQWDAALKTEFAFDIRRFGVAPDETASTQQGDDFGGGRRIDRFGDYAFLKAQGVLVDLGGEEEPLPATALEAGA